MHKLELINFPSTEHKRLEMSKHTKTGKRGPKYVSDTLHTVHEQNTLKSVPSSWLLSSHAFTADEEHG